MLKICYNINLKNCYNIINFKMRLRNAFGKLAEIHTLKIHPHWWVLQCTEKRLTASEGTTLLRSVCWFPEQQSTAKLTLMVRWWLQHGAYKGKKLVPWGTDGWLPLTLTLVPAIRHTVVHHSSTSTYVPNFTEIGRKIFLKVTTEVLVKFRVTWHKK